MPCHVVQRQLAQGTLSQRVNPVVSLSETTETRAKRRADSLPDRLSFMLIPPRHSAGMISHEGHFATSFEL